MQCLLEQILIPLRWSAELSHNSKTLDLSWADLTYWLFDVTYTTSFRIVFPCEFKQYSSM